ncbi:MAG: hypothetical protein LBL06_05205, partial [Treponema sp.]|nr:hypothetical protein [Treponema sp.]
MKILYGKSKKPIAMLIPLEGTNTRRKIGILDGIASYNRKYKNYKVSFVSFIDFIFPFVSFSFTNNDLNAMSLVSFVSF